MKRSQLKRGTSQLKRGKMKPRKFSKQPTVDGASLRDLKDDCDNLIRTIVALRDEKCITCPAREGLHVGHYITRKVLALRWELDNVCGQCDLCNGVHNTQPYFYRMALAHRHGATRVAELDKIAEKNPRVTYVDVLAIRDRLRREVVKLAK